MKLLTEVICRFWLWSHQYADGSHLSLIFICSCKIVERLNCCLISVMDWIGCNEGKHNSDRRGTVGSWTVWYEIGFAACSGWKVWKCRCLVWGCFLIWVLFLQVVRGAFSQYHQVQELSSSLTQGNLATVIPPPLVTFRWQCCNCLCGAAFQKCLETSISCSQNARHFESVINVYECWFYMICTSCWLIIMFSCLEPSCEEPQAFARVQPAPERVLTIQHPASS